MYRVVPQTTEMGNGKARYGNKHNRNVGRQPKPTSKAVKDKYNRDGLPRLNAASSDRAEQIKITGGSGGSHGKRLTDAILLTPMKRHGDKTLVVRGKKSAFAGRSEEVCVSGISIASV